MKRIIFIE